MPIGSLPPETAWVARAAFPTGHRDLRVADARETLCTDDASLAFFPTPGQLAQPPRPLALVAISTMPQGPPIAKRRLPGAAASMGHMAWRWRQLQCVARGTYVLETHGTPLHGTRAAPELVVWAVGALAEGLGIRAVTRVFAVDPNTVLQWLVEAADQAAALSRYVLHDVRVTQVQLNELFALLSAIKAEEASGRVSRKTPGGLTGRSRLWGHRILATSKAGWNRRRHAALGENDVSCDETLCEGRLIGGLRT
jgi:hypothetical protein